MLALRRFHGRPGRVMLLLAAVLTAGTLVAGCGGGDDDSGDAADSATTAKAGAPAEIQGTVRWSMLEYDPKVEAWANGVIEDFEAEHSAVDIELTLPPTNSYQQLLTTQLRGENPPDLAAVPTAWVPAFADAGALVPWTERVDDALLGRFEPTLLEGAKIDGELYALPYLSTSRALFYNEEAFEQAGLDGAPETWDDLIADGEAVQSEGGAEYGFAMQGTGVEAFAAWFPYVYWSYGGELTGPEGGLTIDQEACVRGMSVLQRLVAETSQPNVTAADLPEQLQLFTSGEAAMTITGPWLVGTLAAEAENMKYGVAPIPAGTTSTTLDVQDAFILFEDGKNADAAVEFAKFLYEPENADSLVEGRGMLPVLTEGFDAPRYQEEPLKTFVDLVRKGKFAPSDPGWLKLADSGARALQAMYTDGVSPEETCEAIAEAAQS